MNLLSERRDGILILSLEGRLDVQGAMELEDFLRNQIQETDRTAVLDMAGVVYLSSAGVRTIMVTEKKLKAMKGDLQICGVQPYPLSVLDMTGFSSVLSLHPTRDDAVRAARSMLALEDSRRHHEAIPFHVRELSMR